MIIYENIPCPVLLKEESDTFLILFKDEQKWIFKCSIGYGKVEKNGNGIFYLFNKKLHRENGPACEYSDGYKEWLQNGKLHRTDGPACEYSDGSKSWYQNGELHRLDGPAIEYINSKEWYKNGELHRENGPAVEYSDGSKEYWTNGVKMK